MNIIFQDPRIAHFLKQIPTSHAPSKPLDNGRRRISIRV
jgi:hypothetical protein